MKEETTPTAGLQVEDIKRVTPLIRAMYLGQVVFEYRDFRKGETILLSTEATSRLTVEGWLNLRPLSSITDDEAVKVARFYQSCLRGYEIEYGKDLCLNLHDAREDKYGAIAPWRMHNVIFFLYQHGFALPFYDSVTNTTITVEMQVSSGIIKLRS